MQLRYKTHMITHGHVRHPEDEQLGGRQTGAPPSSSSSSSSLKKQGLSFPVCTRICSGNLRRGMDFILPPTLPAAGIPWEKVLPPLIPHLNGTYGQYKWSPKLLIPDPENNSSAEVNCDDSGFTVQVDVKDFNPEDLMVKVIGDFVEVQGKHEEKKKEGPGFTTRQFNRRYRIPKGVNTMALESAVSPDGILIISAPMLQTENSRVLT